MHAVYHHRRFKYLFRGKGSGAPVLFISGTGGDLRQRPNILNSPLPKHHRVIAYDQRGLGQTEKLDRPYTMSEYGDDGGNARRTWHRAGGCYWRILRRNGGSTLCHPPSINDSKVGAVLHITGGDMPSYPFHLIPEDLTPEERFLKLVGILILALDQKWRAEHHEQIQAMIKGVLQARIPDHDSSASGWALGDSLKRVRTMMSTTRYPSIDLPTMISAGRYDGIAPAANQHHMASLMPNAVLKWYEGGHMFMIQDKNAWSDVIAFLNTPDS